jgi:hypothetical protein
LVDSGAIFADVLTEEIVKADEKQRGGMLMKLIEEAAAAEGVFVRLSGAVAWAAPRDASAPSGAQQSLRFTVSVPPALRLELLKRVSALLRARGVVLRERRTPAGQKLFKEMGESC